MKQNTEILNKLLRAEKKARSSKWIRLFRHPIQYPALLAFNYFLYPLINKGFIRKAKTFFDIPMKTMLPSGTDIVLNQIKSHDSEIRLSKFLVLTLRSGNTFIDVGAHYGYYSLLASTLVGDNGQVFSIEPTKVSFDLLRQNCSDKNNIVMINSAASYNNQEVTFFEYAGPYSEYNTMVKDMYDNKKWARHLIKTINKVPGLVLDELLEVNNIHSAIVKIDVEGGEANVVRGMSKSLLFRDLIVIMEYLKEDSPQSRHDEAVDLLRQSDFEPYSIEPDGTICRIENLHAHMMKRKLSSDNIVFNRI